MGSGRGQYPSIPFPKTTGFVKKKIPILSLRDFFNQVKKPASVSSSNPTVVITFDDGYKDVWEYAWPILRDFHISPAFFVCTDPLIRKRPLLWDLLTQAVQLDTRDQLPVDSSLNSSSAVSLQTQQEKGAFVLTMNRHLLGKSGEDQRKAFQDLFKPIAKRVILQTADLYLGPEQIKECLKAGIEIGSHTASHPYLPFLTRQEWDCEIRGSKTELEALLGVEVPFFSYPAGKWNEEIREYVIRSGYQGALATGKRAVSSSHQDLFSLPRISPEGVMTMGKFFALVSGVKREWFH